MALREISEFRRQSLRNALNLGLGASVFALSNFAYVSSTFAQLRTGRSSDREFYTPTEPKPAATSKAVSKRTKSEVVQASANELVSEEETPIRQVKRSQNTVRHAAGEHPPSHVVQAGCKSCQAGVSHSHPIAARPSQVVVDEEESMDLGLSDAIHDPNGMVYGSTCQPCMTGPETGLLIQTPPIIGSILCRMQLRIEAATFWPEGQNLPQLVTTRRPANDPATDGLIGRNDTTNLFGGSNVLGESTQGLRGDLGTYFDPSKSHGVLVRFFYVASNSLSYNSTPTSEPVVMRPFFSTANNAQSTVAVNYPNSTSGSLNAKITSDVYGGDILFRKLILRDCAGRVEFLAGYQNARLAEDLSINSTTTALVNTPAPAGTVSQLSDHFHTINRFNGMALGFNGILRQRNWSLSGLVKLGLGNMERNVTINGSSTITVPGNPGSTSTTANGLLARGTNDGNYIQNAFVVTPETNLTFGYRLTPRLEATVGYSYLCLPKVARVADQLDPNLASNLSNPPTGASTPGFSLKESNYALHSLDYGLQWRY
ncbi:MAG: BBP7 family outer membrane beta-barrel protein [Planctomycetota bacterium]|nr:BBP7 family outer membrane beta-barrel protein [Planctomycetota bacterium]